MSTLTDVLTYIFVWVWDWFIRSVSYIKSMLLYIFKDCDCVYVGIDGAAGTGTSKSVSSFSAFMFAWNFNYYTDGKIFLRNQPNSKAYVKYIFLQFCKCIQTSPTLRFLSSNIFIRFSLQFFIYIFIFYGNCFLIQTIYFLRF